MKIILDHTEKEAVRAVLNAHGVGSRDSRIVDYIAQLLDHSNIEVTIVVGHLARPEDNILQGLTP